MPYQNYITDYVNLPKVLLNSKVYLDMDPVGREEIDQPAFQYKVSLTV